MCAFVRNLSQMGQYAVDIVTHARRADGCPHGRTSRKKGEVLCGVDVKFVKQLWVAVGKEERRAGGQDAMWVRANNFPSLYRRRETHPPTPDVAILSPPQAPVLSGPQAYFTARAPGLSFPRGRIAGSQAGGTVKLFVCAQSNDLRLSPRARPSPSLSVGHPPAYYSSSFFFGLSNVWLVVATNGVPCLENRFPDLTPTSCLLFSFGLCCRPNS